jgi:hypothetical protein
MEAEARTPPGPARAPPPLRAPARRQPAAPMAAAWPGAVWALRTCGGRPCRPPALCGRLRRFRHGVCLWARRQPPGRRRCRPQALSSCARCPPTGALDSWWPCNTRSRRPTAALPGRGAGGRLTPYLTTAGGLQLYVELSAGAQLGPLQPQGSASAADPWAARYRRCDESSPGFVARVQVRPSAAIRGCLCS